MRVTVDPGMTGVGVSGFGGSGVVVILDPGIKGLSLAGGGVAGGESCGGSGGAGSGRGAGEAGVIGEVGTVSCGGVGLAGKEPYELGDPGTAPYDGNELVGGTTCSSSSAGSVSTS